MTRSRLLHRLLVPALLVLVCTVAPAGASTEASAVNQITLSTDQLAEASGLAASQRAPGVLWAHNDGGDAPTLYALATDGRLLARLTLEAATHQDWEDMASFRDQGEPWLVVADVGDNSATRETLTLYFLREPELPADASFPADLAQRVERTLRFRLEGGPADIESLAVDPARDAIILVGKRQTPPAVYQLPLHPPDTGHVLTAERIGQIPRLPPPDLSDIRHNFTLAPFLRQPTALDHDASTGRFLVAGYADAHLFACPPSLSLKACFAATPDTLQLPMLPQTEGAAFCQSGRALCFISEKLPTLLMQLPSPVSDTTAP